MVLQYGAGGAILPFLTPYLKSRGYEIEDISWLVFASAGLATFVPFLWGALADRFLPVNWVIVLMHFGAGVALYSWWHAPTFANVLVGYAIYAAFQLPSNSLVNALSFHQLDDAVAQFGRLRLWGSVGWMLPAFPIGYWLSRLENPTYDSIVWFGLAYHALVVLLAKVWPHTPPLKRDPGAKKFVHDVRELLREKEFSRLLVAAFFIFASFPAMFYMTPLALERAGVEKASLGPMLTVGVVLEIPLFMILRRFYRRVGARVVLVVGVASVIVRHLVFATSTTELPLFLATLTIAPAIVFFVIGCSLVIERVAERKVRATAQAFLHLTGAGFGSMAGLLGCALLARVSDRDDLSAIFYLGAATATIGFVALFWVPFGRADTVQSTEESSDDEEDRRTTPNADGEARAAGS